MEYEWRDAPSALSDVVEGLWYLAGPAPSRVERIFPMTEVHLIVNLADEAYRVSTLDGDGWRELGPVFCSGMRSFPVLSANPEAIRNAGAVLRPDGLRGLGLDPVALAEAVSDVGIVERPQSPDADAVLTDLESALTRALRPEWRPDALVRSVLDALRADPSRPIAELASEGALGHPALVARFRATTGITPKLFAELVRFHRLIDRMPVAGDVSWSELAAESGYYDQSHVNRYFKRFTGFTPAAYHRRVRDAGPDSVRFVPTDDLPPLG